MGFGVPNGKPVELKEHKAQVQAVVFSPVDDYVLVSGGEDGLVKVWNVEKGCETQGTLIPALIYGLDVDGEGAMVAVGSADDKVRLYWFDKHLSCKNERSGRVVAQGRVDSTASRPGRRNARDGGNVDLDL